MSDSFGEFSVTLVKKLTEPNSKLKKHINNDHKLQIAKSNGDIANLDLTPFISTPQPVTANTFFWGVSNVTGLFNAYDNARDALPFEKDVSGTYNNVCNYADQFLSALFSDAKSYLTNEQAAVIAEWVSDLDIYAAVKATESLLNSRADIALLMLAKQRDWIVHFDHMAIRCGSSSRKDAEHVVELLCKEHDYVSSQVEGEDYYQFPEGWNAYPLYKMLENGQVLRIFVDQSGAGHPEQIIQHWNYVYGYTAHHLAMRVTRVVNCQRVAVGLDELITALQNKGVNTMTPTGMYTEGLLQQVFTKPERNEAIPEEIMQSFQSIDAMQAKIGNGKLLELVSRKEVDVDLANQYFALYGLTYDASNPLHSVPIYHYFLPAQAAHVIKTSIETDN
ncbi:MAG: hypothetical protein GXP19_02980 [Gammaproteobacteria bacterium]|nr:hypothetical protein [Gammaproteobacteria bacterium]